MLLFFGRFCHGNCGVLVHVLYAYMRGSIEREDEEKEDDGKDDSENEVRRNNVGQLSSTAPFVVIRLNGMAHADEKVALREISHQLFLDYESHKIGSRSFPGCWADARAS